MSRIRLTSCLLIATLAITLSMAAPGFADVILLKNGKKMTGLIRSESPQWVQIETGGGLLTIERARIESIEKRPTAENLYISGMLALKKPDFLLAGNLLKQALQNGSAPADVRKAIIENAAGFLDKLPLLSTVERAQWTALCDELSSAGGAPDPEWIYWRGEMAVAANEPDEALNAWRRIDPSYYTFHPNHQKRISAWALKKTLEALKARDIDQCVAMLDLLTATDPEWAKSGGRAFVLVQQAAEARDRGNVVEACRIYAEELMPLSPTLATNYLRTTLDRQAKDLTKQGDFEAAIKVLRQWGQPHLPEEAPKLLSKAYLGFIQRELSQGRFEQARARLAEGSQFFDDAELETLQQRCEFGERRAKLGATDYLAHYQLAREMQDKNLTTEALEEFYVASQSPQLKKLADERIKMIREQEADAMVEEMLVMYKNEKYLDLLDKIDEFRQKYSDSPNADEVNRLSKQAHEGAAKSTQTKRQLAASMYAEAHRSLLLNEYDKALELVDQLLLEYPNSPEALEAQRLKRDVVKRRGGSPGIKFDAHISDGGTTKTLPSSLDPNEMDRMNEDAFIKEVEALLKQRGM